MIEVVRYRKRIAQMKASSLLRGVGRVNDLSYQSAPASAQWRFGKLTRRPHRDGKDTFVKFFGYFDPSRLDERFAHARD